MATERKQVQSADPKDGAGTGAVPRKHAPIGVPGPHIMKHCKKVLDAIQRDNVPQFTPIPSALKKRVIAFCGNFGSGKTEIAINFAIQLAQQEEYVRIADLDIVNPYFRCRESAAPLVAAGVEVIAPPGEQMWADLPIIMPEIRGGIQRGDGHLVLDVGGDDLGARVLANLKEAFTDGEYDLVFVVNKNRPFTENTDGALKIFREIEKASKLKITGLASNTHLMRDTTPEMIEEGYRMARELARSAEIPVVLVTVERRLYDEIDETLFQCPVFPLDRFMLPPWE